MNFRLILCVLVAVAACLGGCGSSPDDALLIQLDDLPRETPKRDIEWRRAWTFPGGEAKRIDLSVPAGAGVLRLDVLPRGTSDATVHARVYLDDRELLRFSTTEVLEWTDKRITFAPSESDRKCSIVLESTREFWVGPCEVIAPRQKNPNVLIVLIDTLRQDHLSCYNYPRATSPTIDALAADGIRFNTLIPQSSWTRPSTASLLTSCYPGTHGAIDRDTMMRPGLPTLGDNLRRAGYETHALIMNPSCLPTWNIAVEFDRVLDLVGPDTNAVDDAVGVDEAIKTVESADGRPWFLYLHLMGPHDPYVPPAPYDTMFRGGGHYPEEVQNLVDQYDGEIAYTDAQIGRLIATLKDLDQYDDTFIMVLSDHGEQFGEHGAVGHGHSLHCEELGIPFVVKRPDAARKGVVNNAVIEVVDIAPTILETLGYAVDPRFEGRSFSELLNGGSVSPRRAFASLYLGQLSMDMARDAAAKHIRDHATGARTWYDLANDPGEQNALTSGDAVDNGLSAHAARIAAKGATGFNILITPGTSDPKNVSLLIRGVPREDIDVDYAADCVTVTHEEDTIRVDLSFGECYDNLVGAGTWFREVEQDSARITTPAPQNTAPEITLLADGQPVENAILAGKSQIPTPPDTKLSLQEIAANPSDFDPALLPRKLAAYIWFTPSPERIADDDLDPEMLDMLKSLGYLR